MKRSAFTMVELIFVIVILGILASIAVPKLTATRRDAQITRYASDISTIRSAISTTRSENLLQGNPAFPPLEGLDATKLFEGVLTYPIQPAADANGRGWTEVEAGKTYNLDIDGDDVTFTYSTATGIFTCAIVEAGDLCSQLIQ
ncbi:MAG: prepilin-type N-terminal cleavage/methylation domain-containing protein [Campylobacteraceae bacterium]|jgi:general secretion pathway protein G|nr:prepilin-type N-terminal cleavage/methylation domain-containing protein [Campylobacteraceae bacterium]